MKHKIVYKPTGSVCEVDEGSTLGEIRDALPNFFGVRFGKRETFTMYRGFVIVRHTMTHSDRTKVRRTVLYSYCTKGKDVSCINCSPSPQSVRQAQRFIDRLIDVGEYEYGVNLS